MTAKENVVKFCKGRPWQSTTRARGAPENNARFTSVVRRLTSQPEALRRAANPSSGILA
jgi:hypothetical protein